MLAALEALIDQPVVRHGMDAAIRSSGGRVADAGKQVSALAQRAILGHANLATTQIYAEMVNRRMNESIRALDYGAMPAGTLKKVPMSTRQSTQEPGGESQETGAADGSRTGTDG
jgi:hypothetical protein